MPLGVSSRIELADITPGVETYNALHETGGEIITNPDITILDPRKLTTTKLRADDAPDVVPCIPPDERLRRKELSPAGETDICFICDQYPPNMVEIKNDKLARIEQFMIAHRTKIPITRLAKLVSYKFELEIRGPLNAKRKDGQIPIPPWKPDKIYSHIMEMDKSHANMAAKRWHQINSIIDHVHDHGIYTVPVDSNDSQNPANIMVDYGQVAFYLKMIKEANQCMREYFQIIDRHEEAKSVYTVHTHGSVDVLNMDILSRMREEDATVVGASNNTLLTEEDPDW